MNKREQYEICLLRGHQPSLWRAVVAGTNVCKYCGTQYGWKHVLMETNVPEEK